MARIELSDKAPESGFEKISLAQGEYEVPFESDDPIVLANAASHPWLKVVPDEGFELDEEEHPFYDPSKEALSSYNSIANDPEELQKARDEREVLETSPVAIDAGLDQGESLFAGTTPVTFAAVDVVEPTEVEEQPVADEPKPSADVPAEEPSPVEERPDLSTEPSTPFDFDDTDDQEHN